MKDKKAITTTSKLIIVGQLIFVISVFVFVLFFTPRLEYPRNGEIIEHNVIDFKFRNANVILIDNNEDFSSPKEINVDEINSSKVLFEPGTYYWKAIGIVKSTSRSFTIPSNVGLELNEENSTIKNVGNSIIDVTLEGDSGTEGLVILDVDVEYPVEIKNKTKFRGEQHEE